jgi:hypothetical protein
MTDVSRPAAARARIAAKDALGPDAIISRSEQEKDILHLDVAVPHGQQQVLFEKLTDIGGLLRREGVSVVLLNGKHSVFSPVS